MVVSLRKSLALCLFGGIVTWPSRDYDSGMIENADTPDPPVEGVDFVYDTVNTLEGPKTIMIKRPRP